MRINERGRSLIEEFEGFRLTAYRDLRGILSIGYGHTGGDVLEGMTITQEEAVTLLEQDLQNTERGVTRLVTYEMNENEFSAVVCLVYNIGINNFKSSTLLRYLNMGEFEFAADEFLMWDKATVNGVLTPEPGLLRRREAEQTLFNTPVESDESPT